MARPRIPAALKAKRGDTRKLGALVHAESIDAAWIPGRGAPPEPEEFEPVDLADDQDPAEWKRQERIKACARKHWDYITNELAKEGMLATMDGGVLAAGCWTYALMTQAALEMSRGFADLQDRYLKFTSACGLNEVARAKINRPGAPAMSATEAALCADLPPGVHDVQ